MEVLSRSLLRKHYPGIDSLRGFALLLVFLCHYGTGSEVGATAAAWGWTGVDVFFVLSGFLITGILFDSMEEKHCLRKFYFRRAVRIFPLYYAFWIAMIVLTPVLHTQWSPTIASNLVYASNLTPALSEWSWALHFRTHLLPHDPLLNISHFWTLCVEEQFYMTWPLLMLLLRDRVRLMRFCGAAAVAVPVLRIAAYMLLPVTHVTTILYYMTWFRCDGLFLGAFLALWLRGTTLEEGRLKTIYRSVAAVAVVAIAAAQAQCMWFHPGYGREATMMLPWVKTIGYSLFDVLAACLLMACLFEESWPYRILRGCRLEKLGRVSYGFYILHHLPLTYINVLLTTWTISHYVGRLARWHIGFVIPLGFFGLYYGLAQLSFRYLESPFLRLKNRYAKTKADPQPYPVAVG